jgi:hypothetical protein
MHTKEPASKHELSPQKFTKMHTLQTFTPPKIKSTKNRKHNYLEKKNEIRQDVHAAVMLAYVEQMITSI